METNTTTEQKIVEQKILTLDESLSHIPMIRQGKTWNSKAQKYDYFDLNENKVFFDSFTIPKNEELVHSSISGTVRHKSFLTYLETAYNFHKGIVIRPDDFWYIMLAELASVVKKRPEDFSSLFTNSPEKKDVIIFNADPVDMRFDTLIDALRDLVPSNTDAFLPQFSTSNQMTKLAFYASFADMVSPYYDYMMLLCGIPKIKIMGDSDQYQSMCSKISEISLIFIGDEAVTKYLTRIHELFSEIAAAVANDDIEFFKRIFTLEKCGSGSQVEVNGWIKRMYMDEKVRPGYVENFPTNVSVVEYKNLDTNKNYKKYVGLFGSSEDDGFLVPEYGYFINEVK